MKRGIVILMLILIVVVFGVVYFYSGEKSDDLNCASEGEQFSDVYEEYPESCCNGLTEWPAGLNTDISIGNKCYETGLLSGNPVGICIKTEDGVCSKIENVCNSPDDCSDGENSEYTLENFCSGWEDSPFKEFCDQDIYDLELCDLCH